MASPNQSGRKWEMPMFDGNTEIWIIEAEGYSSFHKSLEDNKLCLLKVKRYVGMNVSIVGSVYQVEKS